LYYCIPGLAAITVDNPSTTSSVTVESENPFLLLPELPRQKQSSPPTLGIFPLCCLNFFECSEEYLKAVFELKTVKCNKCNHAANANEYEASNFTKACLCNSKPSGSSGSKKHAETAYLSCLAYCKHADNEIEMIRLWKVDMSIKKAERERDDLKRATRMEAELRLEKKRQSAQEYVFQMQADAASAMQAMQAESAAAMKAMIHTVIPKKLPLDKYKEQKATIAAMPVSGDISNDVATQLMD